MPTRRSAVRRAWPWVGAWLALVGAATAATAGAMWLPADAERVRAVTVAQIVGATEARAVEDEQGQDEGTAEVEVPVVEVVEAADPEDELERLPADEGEAARVSALDIPAGTVEVVEGAAPWIVHHMAPLETVDQVAARYGVSNAALRRWNGLETTTVKLKTGAAVNVRAQRIPPARVRVEYVVQAGDSWSSIALAHGIDSKDVRAFNWDAPRRLRVGTVLTLWVDPVVYHWLVDTPLAPEEIRRGAVSIGAPAAGRLVNGVQVPEGEGYTAKLPESAYGTTHAVTHLVAGLAAFREQHTFEGDILLGSMSRRHGGPIGGHRSHQTGRDIDIRLPLRAGVPSWFPIRPWRVDWTAVWHLLVALIDTGEVQIVFMDYGAQKYLHRAAVALGVEEAERRRVLQWPIGYKAHRGIVRHAPGHTQHVHVRFRCGTFEPECVPESELPSGE